MHPAELGAQALGVSVDEVIGVALLRDGLTNDSWLVQAADAAVVVRINNPHAQALYVDRNIEAGIVRAAAAGGIAPEVLLCDPARHVLVTRYLGSTCTAADLHVPERIERLGSLLRRLHSLSPVVAHVVHWPEVIAHYVATLATMNRDTRLLDEHVRSRIVELAVEIERTSRQRCLCHNDVHYLNLIDAGRLQLIDWEYAGMGDPYFDLASAAFYADFSLDERAQLVRAYAGEVDAASMQRLAKACLVVEYVHDLWHEVRAGVG